MPTDKLDAQLTPRIFFNKVLAGTASGTIIALIPNAVLGAILKYFAEYKIIEMIIHAAQIFQLATPLINATENDDCWRCSVCWLWRD